MFVTVLSITYVSTYYFINFAIYEILSSLPNTILKFNVKIYKTYYSLII